MKLLTFINTLLFLLLFTRTFAAVDEKSPFIVKGKTIVITPADENVNSLFLYGGGINFDKDSRVYTKESSSIKDVYFSNS